MSNMEVLPPAVTAPENAAVDMHKHGSTDEYGTKAGAFTSNKLTPAHQLGQNERSAMDKCRESLGDPTYQLLRSAMIQQQELFAEQLWDLHRLTCAQARKVALHHHNLYILADQNESARIFSKQRQEHIRKQMMSEIFNLKSVASSLRSPRCDKAGAQDHSAPKFTCSRGLDSMSPSSDRPIQLGHDTSMRNGSQFSHVTVGRNLSSSTPAAKRDLSRSPELPLPVQAGVTFSQSNPAAVPNGCPNPNASSGYPSPPTIPSPAGCSQNAMHPHAGVLPHSSCSGHMGAMQSTPLQQYPLAPSHMQSFVQGGPDHCSDPAFTAGSHVPPALLNLHGVMNVPIPEQACEEKEPTLASTHSCSLWSGNALFLPSGVHVQDVMNQHPGQDIVHHLPGKNGLGSAGLVSTVVNLQSGEAGKLSQSSSAGKPQEEVQKNHIEPGMLKDDAAATILMSLKGS